MVLLRNSSSEGPSRPRERERERGLEREGSWVNSLSLSSLRVTVGGAMGGIPSVNVELRPVRLKMPRFCNEWE